MTEAHPAHSTRRASRDHEGTTPSITIMALLTGLGGMATTYLLMSAFHSPQPAFVYRSARVGDRRCFHCALPIPTRVLFCGLCEPGFEARLTESRVYFMCYAGHPAPEQCEGCTSVTSQGRELSYIHSRDVTYATSCQGPYEESAGTATS